MDIKYPHIKVQLVGRDGNALAIIGRVTSALRRAGVPAVDRQAFQDEAMKGDYDNVLATAQRWVDVDGESDG